MSVRGVRFKYENPTAKRYFDDFELMKKKIGIDIARNTKKRCNELKAAENFAIYLKTGLGKPHSLAEDLKGWYGIAVSGNIRLIVKPDMEESDDASFEKCDSVIIRGLVDYHGRKNEWLIP